MVDFGFKRLITQTYKLPDLDVDNWDGVVRSKVREAVEFLLKKEEKTLKAC
jgi:hypothetical protein